MYMRVLLSLCCLPPLSAACCCSRVNIHSCCLLPPPSFFMFFIYFPCPLCHSLPFSSNLHCVSAGQWLPLTRIIWSYMCMLLCILFSFGHCRRARVQACSGSSKPIAVHSGEHILYSACKSTCYDFVGVRTPASSCMCIIVNASLIRCQCLSYL